MISVSNSDEKLQDIMSEEIFQTSGGDLSESLKFMERHATPVTPKQLAGIAYLAYLDRRSGIERYDVIVKAVMDGRDALSSPGTFIDVIEKITLGDRLVGKVRLNNLFKGDGQSK